MTEPLRDDEYPSRLWVPRSACEHPREHLTLVGHFPPDNIDASVFRSDCLKCGSHWDQDSRDVPWDQLMEKLVSGAFTAVSSDDPEIMSKVERQRLQLEESIRKEWNIPK